MNHYFDLAPPMLARFLLVFFHHMKRVDRDLASVVSGSASEDDRQSHEEARAGGRRKQMTRLQGARV